MLNVFTGFVWLKALIRHKATADVSFLRRHESGVPDENRDRGYKWFPAFAGTTSGSQVRPGMTDNGKGPSTRYTIKEIIGFMS